jgi:NAD(P)-dependent dehydrogenase (short-subunit alcohol dehydrogenase family)
MSVFDIKNKNIILTGASGLFGKVLFRCFLEKGANVTLCIHNRSTIEIIEKELEREFPSEKYLITHLEITDENSIHDCIEKSIEKFNSIDVLINNAAVDASYSSEKKNNIIDSGFEDYPIESVKKSIAVNMIGTINITQFVCKQMLKQGYGNIVNVGSIYSLLAPNKKLYNFGEEEVLFKPVDYVVSKSFIPNFTRYIAACYSGKNIKCNAIAPHGVYNNQDKEFVQNFSELSPIGRMCEKKELEGPFLFLVSDASSYLNGVTIVLDGGWSSW